MKSAWTTIAIESGGQFEQVPGRMTIAQARQQEAGGLLKIRYVTERGRREMQVRKALG